MSAAKTSSGCKDGSLLTTSITMPILVGVRLPAPLGGKKFRFIRAAK